MTVSAICTKCKSTFKLGTRSCPRCHQALTRFKARVKTADGWLTKQTTTVEAAQAFLLAQPGLLTVPESATTPAARCTITLSQVWTSFLPWSMTHLRSWRSCETVWRLRLAPTLGRLPLSEVTPEALYGVLESMAGLAPATRYQARALASRLFTWARRRMGYRGENPVQFIEPERFYNVRTRRLSREERERLLSVLRSWPNRPATLLIEFLVWTGRRRGEVRQLRWDSVDMARGLVTFQASTTKSRKTQTVPLSSKALEVLREALALRSGANRTKAGQESMLRSQELVFKGEAYVFGNLKGNYAWHLNKTWEIVRAKAGIPDVRLHDLRRSALTDMIAAKVPLMVVKELAGHSSIQTTVSRYLHLVPEELREGIESIV